MNFHEYQAKQRFADYGIAVPPGRVARTPEEAVEAAKAIGGDAWMVKAQIHAGGRGKAGGVKYSKSFDDVREYAKGMLGTKMETYQSAGVALPIDSVLGTQATDIAQELFRSVLVRSVEHTSELQSLMRNSYAVFCLKRKTKLN